MGRIVVNKHISDSSKISIDNFASKGEIVISTEPGFEGLYILNDNKRVVKVGQQSSGGSITEDVEEFLKTYYMTSAQTVALVNELSGGVATALSAIGEYTVVRWDNIEGKPTIISEDDVRNITAEEVAKIVASADTDFDTLKEIADWIKNDTTGAAKMANDIAELSAASRVSSDHVTLTKEEYNILVASGSVIVDGTEIEYSPTTYYCIKEGQSTPSSSTEIIINGNDMIVGEGSITQDNILTIQGAQVFSDGVLSLL